jgi:topoisomerase-4 subunit A
MTSITWEKYPQFEVEFGGAHEAREKELIDVADFIAVKSYKAKGKRISTFEVKNITELEPLVKEEEIEEEEEKELATELPEQPAVEPEEIELIDDIPFEIIRPGKDGEPDQMTLIFE